MPCSDASWHALWDHFNRLTTETIRVPRDALNDVINCANGGSPHPIIPDGLIAFAPRAGSRTVEVSRDRLYIFLSAHPGVCHAP